MMTFVTISFPFRYICYENVFRLVKFFKNYFFLFSRNLVHRISKKVLSSHVQYLAIGRGASSLSVTASSAAVQVESAAVSGGSASGKSKSRSMTGDRGLNAQMVKNII